MFGSGYSCCRKHDRWSSTKWLYALCAWWLVPVPSRAIFTILIVIAILGHFVFASFASAFLLKVRLIVPFQQFDDILRTMIAIASSTRILIIFDERSREQCLWFDWTTHSNFELSKDFYRWPTHAETICSISCWASISPSTWWCDCRSLTTRATVSESDP